MRDSGVLRGATNLPVVFPSCPPISGGGSKGTITGPLIPSEVRGFCFWGTGAWLVSFSEDIIDGADEEEKGNPAGLNGSVGGSLLEKGNSSDSESWASIEKQGQYLDGRSFPEEGRGWGACEPLLMMLGLAVA
jgi:hypothetical protein